MRSKEKANLKSRYQNLDDRFKLPVGDPKTIQTDLLITFVNQYPQSQAEIHIDTDEFTALCPWTGLPDFGTLSVSYVPDQLILELKSFKYYLLSFRSVGVVQEDAANRIFKDLMKSLKPKKMHLGLDYRTRGGLHTEVQLDHPLKK